MLIWIHKRDKLHQIFIPVNLNKDFNKSLLVNFIENEYLWGKVLQTKVTETHKSSTLRYESVWCSKTRPQLPCHYPGSSGGPRTLHIWKTGINNPGMQVIISKNGSTHQVTQLWLKQDWGGNTWPLQSPLMFFIISSALSDYTVLLHAGHQTSALWKEAGPNGLTCMPWTQQTNTNAVFWLLMTHGDEDGPSTLDKHTTEQQNRVKHERDLSGLGNAQERTKALCAARARPRAHGKFI